jgi:hypothetical protein
MKYEIIRKINKPQKSLKIIVKIEDIDITIPIIIFIIFFILKLYSLFSLFQLLVRCILNMKSLI